MNDIKSIIEAIEELSSVHADPSLFITDIQDKIRDLKLRKSATQPDFRKTLTDLGFTVDQKGWSEVWSKPINDSLEFEAVVAFDKSKINIYVADIKKHTALHEELITSDFANKIVNFVANYEVPDKLPFTFTLSGDYYSGDFFIVALYDALDNFARELREED
jgi:hypothetical protein